MLPMANLILNRKSFLGILFFFACMIAVSVIPKSSHAFVLLPKECREKQTECMKNQTLDWILIFGEIGYDEDDFFSRLDKIWPKDKPFPVIYLESEGGSAPAGMKVGRILNKRNATVASGNPITNDDGRECSSACSLIAAGAIHRHVKHIAVHQPYMIKNYCKPDQTIVNVSSDFMQKNIDYLTEVNTPTELIEVFKSTPHDQLSEYFYASMVEPERQDIVRWGFYSTPGPGSKVITFPNGFGPRSMTLVEEYQFAIDAGNLEAVHYLTDFYLCQGHGEKPNYKKAVAALRASFEKNDNDAGYRLVSFIKNGKVEGMSRMDAIALLTKLADRNYPDAKVDLALLYYSGEILPKNYLKAIEFVKDAAKQKSPVAYGTLCKFYSDPRVFKRDDIESYKWCDLAIAHLESGKEKDFAIERIHALADRMSDRQIDNAMKREEPWKTEKDEESDEEY
jgi:hypothetical protein